MAGEEPNLDEQISQARSEVEAAKKELGKLDTEISQSETSNLSLPSGTVMSQISNVKLRMRTTSASFIKAREYQRSSR